MFYLQNNIIGSFMKLEQILVTNGYSKEDLIIVSAPTADQISVMISSASLIGESNYYQDGRKASVSEVPLRKISTSSYEKKVSFDREVSIQEEEKQDVESPVKKVEETVQPLPVFNDIVHENTQQNPPDLEM